MDYLSFNNFISPGALIVLYYTGAILLPVVTWLWILRLAGKSSQVSRIFNQGRHSLWQRLNKRQRSMALGGFIICFLLTELFWRMLFEFLIAYMQIHEAIVSAPLLLSKL